MANSLMMTCRIKKANGNSIYDISHKKIYEPIELELNKEGGLKFVKNSFKHSDDLEFDFDKREKLELSSIDIFSINMNPKQD